MAAVYWLMAAFYCLMAPFYCLMKKDDWPSPAVLAVPSGGDVVLQPPHLLSMSEPEPEAAPLMREFLDYAHITNPETAEGEQRTDSLVLRERSLERLQRGEALGGSGEHRDGYRAVQRHDR
jgi:hypothetical protein